MNLRDAGPHVLPGPTDGLVLLARHIPGLTVTGFHEGGVLAHYHTPGNAAANMDFDAAWARVCFACRVLRKMAAYDVAAEPHPA